MATYKISASNGNVTVFRDGRILNKLQTELYLNSLTHNSNVNEPISRRNENIQKTYPTLVAETV